MKILKIKFNNINSLKGEQEIDFTKNPFASGSLFAITGPTGSGKSSILDVISLALFNQIPRLGGISKNELSKTGAVITKNQLEASAEISYECKSGKFTSKWSIAYNRNNNLNDYGMELSELETGNILDLKKSEVPAKNEELIGLNYAQFIKSVVLAQGEFAQFLKAKKDERADLLEKITGTGIYRELGIAAFEKFKSVNNTIKEKQAEISAIQNHLLEEAEFRSLQKQLAKNEKEVKAVEVEGKKLEASIHLKESILSNEKEIAQLQEKTSESKADLAEFQQQYGHPLQEHEKLQPHAASLRLWNQKQERFKETEIDIKNTQNRIKESAEKEEILIVKAQELTGKEIQASDFETQVHAFVEKVTILQEQKKDKQQEYSSTLEQLKRELKGIEFQFDPKNADISLETLQNLGSAQKEELKPLESEMKGLDTEHLPAVRKELQQRLTAIFQSKQEAGQISEIKTAIHNLLIKEGNFKKEKDQIPTLISSTQKQIELSSEKLHSLKIEKENKQLKAELSDLRHQLSDNEPCPLCGSIHHPYASEEQIEEDDLSKQINEQQLSLDQQKEKRTQYQSRLELLEKQIEDIIIEKKTFENKLSALEESFKANAEKLNVSNSSINWDEISKATEKQLESIDNIQELRSQRDAITEAIPLHKTLNQTIIEGRELDQRLKTLYKGENIHKESRTLTDKWIGNNRDKQHYQKLFQDLDESLNKQTQELNKLKTELSAALKSLGFHDISSALSALMDENQYLNLRNQREQFQKQIDAGLEQMHLLNKQLAELKKNDQKESLGDIRTALDKLNEQKAELQQLLDEIRSQIKTQNNYLVQLEALKQSIAETEKKNLKWKLLNELIGDATGKKFNDFAQDLSLSQLLILANKRLKDLSDRYLLDKPNLKNEDDSLVAIDAHMGGQRRSVKTLSGGETFILSLSMALALSDLASRNVNINSLFIDEGFGTLDPETLDQTLDTLEKLQAESSKTIGIISHVDSLKERISTQIQLSRNGQGYSKIEIVG
jgi:exonuclease SbcC